MNEGEAAARIRNKVSLGWCVYGREISFSENKECLRCESLKWIWILREECDCDLEELKLIQLQKQYLADGNLIF